MHPATALAAVAALALLAIVIAVVSRRRDGRRRSGGGLAFRAVDAAPAALGSRATLVQFSTDMCARCPQVRRLLSGYADGAEGIHHVEIDLTHRPDLASRYRVLQTPTTFLVDSTGAVRSRFHGVPPRQALADAIASF